MNLAKTTFVPLLFACCLGVMGCTTGPSKREQMAVYLDDSATTNAIRAKYAVDITVMANRVGVSTSNGVVTLSGTVISQAAKDRAETLARSVENVRDVKNEIIVRP